MSGFSYDSLHLGLDTLEILRRDARGDIEVVVEARGGRGPDIKFDVLKNAADGGGHHVRGTVANPVQIGIATHGTSLLITT